MVPKIGENKNSPQGWKISAKDDILTVQQKQIARRVNKTKIILEINLQQIEIEARRLKAENMQTKKRIEK